MDQQPSDFSAAPPPPSSTISPAWEDESRPIFDRWKDTVIAVFTGPTAFFDSMRQEGGIGAPLVFGIVGGWIGLAAAQVWSFIGTLLHIGMFQFMSPARFGFRVGTTFIGTACGVILTPVVVVFALFVISGILHLCLMLVGGAKRPFETTFRVVAYVYGSVVLLNLVPVRGGPIGAVCALVLYVIGFSRAHRIETWRALVAVLIPVAVGSICCILALTLGVLGAAAVMNGGR